MLGGAEVIAGGWRCEAAHLRNFCKLVAVRASVRLCVREHLLIWKMKACGGSVAKQCLLSASQHRAVRSEAVHDFTSADRYLRLPRTEQAGAKVQERWLQRQSEKVPERTKDRIKRRGERR